MGDSTTAITPSPEVSARGQVALRRALGYALFLHVAWLLAWLLEQYLEHGVEILSTRESRFAYWTAAKLLLWVFPAVLIMHASGRTLREAMAFDRVRAILLWGGLIGVALGLTAFPGKMLAGRPLFPEELGISFFSAVFVAPVVEEVAFRGVILDQLAQRYRFAVANIATSILFVTIHMVGWSFQGVLLQNLMMPIGGAFSIFLISLLLGYVAHKSRSVAASTLTHMLNNLFSA